MPEAVPASPASRSLSAMVITIACLTTIGLLVRVIELGRSFVFDEWVVIQFSRLSWPDFWHYLRFENTPPLFFLLERWWASVAPQTETWLRLLPLVAGTASIPLFFFVVRKLLPPRASLFATTLFTFSAANILESRDLRAYSLTVLFALCYLLFLCRWRTTYRRVDLTLATAAGWLGLMSHLEFGLLLVAAQIAFWLDREARTRWRDWLLATLGLGLAALPWFFYVLRDHTSFVTEPVWMVNLSPTRLTLIGTAMLSLFAGDAIYLAAVGTALIIFWLYVARGPKLRFTGTPVFVLRIFLSLLFIALAVGLLLNVDAPKYYLVPYLSLYTLIAYRWQQTREHRVSTIFAFALIVLLAYQAIGALRGTSGPWRELTQQYLPSIVGADDLVLVHPFPDAESIRYYDRQALRVEGLLPDRFRSDDHFADVLKYNFQKVVNDETVADLALLTATEQRIWFVSAMRMDNNVFSSKLPLAWFQDHGWIAELKAVNRDGSPLVTLLTRPATAAPTAIGR